MAIDMVPADVPRLEDFVNVHEQLELVDRVLKRAEARAQAVQFDEGARACARRRALVGELMTWLVVWAAVDLDCTTGMSA